MLMHSLMDIAKIIKVSDPTTAGTSDVDSTGVDMKGYEGVTFLTSFGTAAANNLVNVQGSSDDGSVDTYADLAGTAVALGGASDEDQVAEVYKPAANQRYLRLHVERGTSTTLGDIWAILWAAHDQPVDNTTTGTIAAERNVSPAEGTA